MQTDKAMAYRLALASGFLAEAEQDITLKRWRSCVDNAQLSVENAGKSALTLFGVVPKTHDPARQLAVVLQAQSLPFQVGDILKRMLPDLVALGKPEHILTDYGDEETYTLPWDIITQKTAMDAIETARRTLLDAQSLIAAVRAWRIV